LNPFSRDINPKTSEGSKIYLKVMEELSRGNKIKESI